MSRSIHDTWGVIRRTRREDYSDAALKDERIEAARAGWRRQTILKQHVRRERRDPNRLLLPCDPETVPVLVVDAGPHIHHAATEEDVRAVLRSLPRGSLDGLVSVRLGLGKELCREWARRGHSSDPYTGRSGRELFPGIHGGALLGCYDSVDRTIDVLAYVYEPGAAGVLEIFLKLQALSTLVHEAGHHFDASFRRAGDRWINGDRARKERYARRMETSWTAQYVAPYLESRYPSECAAFAAWMEEHGGAALPLAAFVDDEHTERGSVASHALQDLVAAVGQGKRADHTRYQFAADLHHAHVAPARAILERLLEGRPGEELELALLACTVQLDGELARAESLCKEALALDPESTDALQVLSVIYRKSRRWAELKNCADRAWRGRRLDQRLINLEHHARACLELGCWNELSDDITELSAREGAGGSAEVFRALLHHRTGRWEEALTMATSLLRDLELGAQAQLDFDAWVPEELAAVRFESAHRLGRPGQAGRLSQGDVDVLRRQGHGAWVDRLVAEQGLRPAQGRTRPRGS